jgi:hypothetical protein
LIQQFGTFSNGGHPLSNGDGQVTNCAHNLGRTWTTLSDASEEVPTVTQLDEERWRLWEMAKANLEKAHKRYKDFANKSRREVNFEEIDEVWLNIIFF